MQKCCRTSSEMVFAYSAALINCLAMGLVMGGPLNIEISIKHV